MFDTTTPTLGAAASSGGEQIDDLLDRRIGTMVGGLEAALGAVFGDRLIVERAVGEHHEASNAYPDPFQSWATHRMVSGRDCYLLASNLLLVLASVEQI